MVQPVARKIHHPLGFSKGYNLVRFIFARAQFGQFEDMH